MITIRINNIDEFSLDYITDSKFCAESFYEFCYDRDAHEQENFNDATMLTNARLFASQYATFVNFIDARTRTEDEAQFVDFDVEVTFDANSQSAALIQAIRNVASRCNVSIVQTYSEMRKTTRNVRVEYREMQNCYIDTFLDVAEILQFTASETNMHYKRFYLTRKL